jgi:hypothetical protein
MLHDIVRENRVKDRMADLKMLSVSDAGSYVSGGIFENKEVFSIVSRLEGNQERWHRCLGVRRGGNMGWL